MPYNIYHTDIIIPSFTWFRNPIRINGTTPNFLQKKTSRKNYKFKLTWIKSAIENLCTKKSYRFTHEGKSRDPEIINVTQVWPTEQKFLFN